MNLKNKFCQSVELTAFTPPLTKIPGSAPVSRTEDQNIVTLPPRIFDFTMSLDNFITSHDDFNMCFDDLTKRAAT